MHIETILCLNFRTQLIDMGLWGGRGRINLILPRFQLSLNCLFFFKIKSQHDYKWCIYFWYQINILLGSHWSKISWPSLERVVTWLTADTKLNSFIGLIRLEKIIFEKVEFLWKGGSTAVAILVDKDG